MTLKQSREPHVVLLATGGTIASRARPEAGGAAVASDTGEQLLESFRPASALPVRVVDVFRRGSYALTFDDMATVCHRIKEVLADPQVLGIVVTHGTDTMEETAYLADLSHDDPRPVVFTGAQNPADPPSPDGPDNLARAVAVAGSPAARGRGVLLSFAGWIFPARGVRKIHTVALDAFGNPDAGTAGSVTAAGDVHLAPPPPGRQILPLPASGQGAGSRVDLVASYPGADGVLLRAALDAGASGIVLQATGTGNANPTLCAAVGEATAAGVTVVTSTPVHAGPVVPIYGKGGGKDLLAAGAVPSGTLRPPQSLILLSLLLRLGTPRPRIIESFTQHGRPPS
ncbi:asparaginase [Arthrobacter deserti]|uniref:asparaginase n=1 Tax=Arthrobacter deserti TaxID=1742687 RepID=A0ABX1JSG0_9MICC|nr:asparaginase [Arthrobacter deserti]